MPISIKHNALFIHIPKTGGKSISSMLGINQHDTAQYYGRVKGLVLTHLTIDQIRERTNISGLYTFAFVRDPYTRIISEYNWRMRNRRAFEEPTGKRMSFEAYCELLLRKWDKIMANPNITERQHVTPQYKYVDSSVDIYKYENYEEDCLKIQKILGIDKPVPKINVGKYSTQHTDRTKEITRMLYGEDFKTFGYDTNIKER